MDVRRAVVAETDALTDLIMRAKRSNGYDEHFMAACYDELAATPKRLAEGEYWVVETDAVLCGCACLVADTDSNCGEVHAFFVDPDWQRKGVGRLLWNKLVERAKRLGLIKLELDSDPYAVPFYQAMGFAITGEVPSGSIAGRVLPRMKITL